MIARLKLWTRAIVMRSPLPVVAYLRMSTPQQKYSIENQLASIREYATINGFELIRLYADEGKSGLRIDGRTAFQNLINEIKAGKPDFRAILVYDVSRWGRFQSSDEAAFHEHTFARAGVKIHYCAELFENGVCQPETSPHL